MKKQAVISFALSLILSLPGFAQIPYLEKSGNSTTLMVDKQPFIMLAGEFHNSSCSSKEYMKNVWADMAENNLNSVLATVSWELIEPIEGQFDFSLVDAIIEGARAENLKLALIWFGTFKNPFNTYAPSWVKTNPKRFPRSQTAEGTDLELPSLFSDNLLDADLNAYVKLMEHIKKTDKDHTVIMMQIGNEPGLRGAPRDYSKDAEKAWNKEVPNQLIRYLKENKNSLQPDLALAWDENGNKTRGSWEDVFGKSITTNDGSGKIVNFTEHIFTAYSFANYLDLLSAEGKKIHPLPTFVNASVFGINTRGVSLGNGCSIPEFFDLYAAGAPNLDILTPNSYKLELDEICEAYSWKGNPILIPESGAVAARPIYAIGEWDALCFSPFGIDDMKPESYNEEQKLYADTYKTLQNMMGLLTSNIGSEKMRGVFIYPGKENQSIEIGNYQFNFSPKKGFDIGLIMGQAGQRAERNRQGNSNAEEATPPAPNMFGPSGPQKPAMGGAILLQISENEFYVVGYGINADITLKDNIDHRFCGYDSIWEGTFENDCFIPGRLLNGDERSVYLDSSRIGALKVKMYYY